LDLSHFLGLSKPLSAQTLVAQLVGLSQNIQRLAPADRVKFQVEMSCHSNELYSQLDAHAKTAGDAFDVTASRLKGIAWYWPRSRAGCDYGLKFLQAKSLAFSSAALVEPYLYVLQEQDAKHADLFRRIGVREAFAATDYVLTLRRMANRYGDAALPPDALDMAVSLIEEIAQNFQEVVSAFSSSVLVYCPDARGRLVVTSELLFNDASWLTGLDSRQDLRLVHQKVSKAAAKAIGCKSLRTLMSVDGKVKTTDLACPSIKSLAALICGADCGSLLFELLEWADAIGARTAHLALDYRHHGSLSVLQPTLGQFQGPALCLFLPEIIVGKAELCQVLSSPSENVAEGAPLRYGPGLAAGFAVAETLAVLSGESYFCFDPSGHFLLDLSEAASADPGAAGGPVDKEYKLSTLSKFPDQLAPFKLFGVQPSAASFKGTVVRLPLRTASQAEHSPLSDYQCASPGALDHIVSPLHAAATNTEALLFCRNLEALRFQRVSDEDVQPAVSDDETNAADENDQADEPVDEALSAVDTVDDGGAPASTAGAGDAEPTKATAKRVDYFELSLSCSPSPLRAAREDILIADWKPAWSLFKSFFKPPATSVSNVRFTYRDTETTSTDEWTIHHALAAGSSRDLAVDDELRKYLHLLPLGACAAKLTHNGGPAPALEGKGAPLLNPDCQLPAAKLTMRVQTLPPSQLGGSHICRST